MDLRRTAVIGEDFAAERADAQKKVAGGTNRAGRIEMTHYSPNELRYRYASAADRVAVFSEIYYPSGWTAALEDGTPVRLFRADWTLRAAVLPAGEHELVMRFDPPAYRMGARVSRASSLVLLLLLLSAAAGLVCKLTR